MLPLLHGAGSVTWRSWDAEPTILLGAVASAGLYAYGLSSVLRSRAEERRMVLLRASSFAAGVALMLVALLSPIDAATDELLSMHMLQHMVIGSLAPPLLLLGLPPALLEGLRHSGLVAAALRLFANPFFAGAVFIANLWVWHAPPLYELAVENLGVHIEMHLAFIAAGLLFWWPVIDPARDRSAMTLGGKMLYLFLASFPMSVLALLLLSASDVIYDPYGGSERLWGISPLADQQVAGVLMGAVGETASFVAFTLLFFQIFSEGESEESRPGQLPRVS